MFGYVMVNKPELKVKDYEKYHGYYCGLCRRLKKRHGRRGQFTLTYDMTFLIILLTSLYEVPTQQEKHTCVVHPMKKHPMLFNEISDYGADMNIALSYHHFRDDWEDEKKISGAMGQVVFKSKYKKIEQRYKRQCAAIEKAMADLAACEANNETDIDRVSRCFGELMAELFIYKEDPFEPILRAFGFYLGKFIYIMDAYMDLESDRKKNCYNPFYEAALREDFESYVKDLMIMMIGEATKEFEKLPCEWDIWILRNVLYEGIFGKYERKQQHE